MLEKNQNKIKRLAKAKVETRPRKNNSNKKKIKYKKAMYILTATGPHPIDSPLRIEAIR